MRALVVGDIIQDILVMPETAITNNDDNLAKLEERTGGSAANFAVWLATLQVETHLIARVGKGDGKKFSAEFSTKDVIAHLQEDPELPTGKIVALVDGDDRTFFTDRGANQNLLPSLIPVEAFGDFVYISGYTVLSIGTEGTQTLIALAQKHGALVVCDPGSASFIRDYGPGHFLKAIEGVDAIFPNLEEALALTGTENATAAADKLAESFDLVVITLGKDGAYVRNPTTAEYVSGVSAEIVDPTGAGDAFAAMFMRTILDSDIKAAEAAKIASKFAAEAMAIVGGQPK